MKISGQRIGRGKRVSRLAGMVVCLAVLLCGCQAGPQAASGGPQNAQKGEAGTAQTITLKTADGWKIAGDLYAVEGKVSSAVVLLHQRGGQASDWVPLCRALQKAGITALAIDQRGAGRSTQGPGPVGEEAPWPTGSDIAAFVAYMRGGEQNMSAVGLAGASYGANNALIYAAGHPSQIKALALFSPGANYHGLDALGVAHACRAAVVIYHDKNDAIAGSGPAKINAALPSGGASGHGMPARVGEHALRLSGGSEHGTGLLTPENIKDAVTFFQRTLK